MPDCNLIQKAEAYMLECLKGDSAHDPYHIYRVLNLSLDIAAHEKDVDLNILILSCLLHDIGRKAQAQNPLLCHAEAGAEMAHGFLLQQTGDAALAQAVRSAILSHRYRSKYTPQSIEAKILFDADTIDATGAMGIARSLQYEGHAVIPIYHTDAAGNIIPGSLAQADSFLREYEFKLRNLYSRFYTQRGAEIARSREDTARQFYDALVQEINASHTTLTSVLDRVQ